MHPAPPPPAVVGRRRDVALVAFAFVVVMAGTNVPTPLYGLYRERFAASALTVTVIFAVLAVAIIGALLAFGRLSDTAGRRPVLGAAAAVSVLAAFVFLLAEDVPALLFGRLLTGLAAGLFVGAGTATIVDLAGPARRDQAAAIAIAANLGGLGVGTLGSAVLGELAGGDPLRVAWAVHLGLSVLAFAALTAVREPVVRRGPVRLRPRIPRVPREVRGVFAPAVLASGCGFAATGVLAAVAALFLAQELGHQGLVLFALPASLSFTGTAVGQLLVRRVSGRVALPGGAAGMLVAVGLIALALATRTLAPLLAGAALLGLAQGFAIGAGLAAVTGQTPPARRAETASAFFVVLYGFLTVPVVGVGLLAQATDLRSAGLAFSAVVAVLLAAALAAQLQLRSSRVPLK